MKQNRLAYLLTIVFFWSACGIALAESQLQTGCSVTADEQTDLTIDCIKIGGVTYKGILNYIGIQKTENGDDLYLWEYPGGANPNSDIYSPNQCGTLDAKSNISFPCLKLSNGNVAHYYDHEHPFL